MGTTKKKAPKKAEEPEVIPPKKEVVKYSDIDLTIMRDKSGVARLFRQNVTLSTVDDTLAKVGKQKVNNNWIPLFTPSALGYSNMGEAAGLLWRNAPYVVIDGKDQANPYPIRDEKNRVIGYIVSAFCWGLNKMQALGISERTIVYDLHQYRAVDALSKCDKVPSVFKLQGINETVPRGYIQIPVDDIQCVVGEASRKEYLEFATSAQNRAKNALATAQTFAQRNAVKNHPNIKFHKTNLASVTVPVDCWRVMEGSFHGLQLPAIGQGVDTIARIIRGEAVDIDGIPVMVTQGQDNLAEEAAETGTDVVAAESQAAPEEGEHHEIDSDDDDLNYGDGDAQTREMVAALRKIEKEDQGAFNKAVEDVELGPSAFLVIEQLKHAELVSLYRRLVG